MVFRDLPKSSLGSGRRARKPALRKLVSSVVLGAKSQDCQVSPGGGGALRTTALAVRPGLTEDNTSFLHWKVERIGAHTITE